MNGKRAPGACLGLKTRSARAVGVAITGKGAAPHAALREEISLGALATPALANPYHPFMELPWNEVREQIAPILRAVESVTTERLHALQKEMRAKGLEIESLAIVGAPDRDLTALGSPHIRAHAAEGVLFRRVWEVAADALGLPWESFAEKGLDALAARRLKCTAGALAAQLAEFGSVLGRPWRIDEKAAALAAWVVRASADA